MVGFLFQSGLFDFCLEDVGVFMQILLLAEVILNRKYLKKYMFFVYVVNIKKYQYVQFICNVWIFVIVIVNKMFEICVL